VPSARRHRQGTLADDGSHRHRISCTSRGCNSCANSVRRCRRGW
jgi:hypothetical protein